jgi:hypothetical protein
MFVGALSAGAADAPEHAPLAPSSPPSAAATVGQTGPKIQFAVPIYDFGKVQSGDLVKYSYVFTNTGDQQLEVTDVRPSCGCTTAGDWTRKVAPGATGNIAIQFNSANFNSQVFKTISVTSNDKQRPVTVLQLKGTVWKSIELIPQYTVINVPPDASSAFATIRVLNHLDESLEVFSPECNNPNFVIVLTTNQPGKEYQVSITSVKDLTANVQGKVALKTSSAKTPTLDLPFWVNVQPPLSVMPQRISLPPAPLATKTPTTVTIQNHGTNQLTLSDAAVNVPGVEVQIKEVQPGKVFNAMLVFPQGFEMPAGKPVALTMKSSQPRMAEIRVPVIQSARPIITPPPAPKPAPSPAVSITPATGTLAH